MVKGQKYHDSEPKRYHILYKTTCKVTENFYIGVHSTTDLEDGYLGSGKRLSRSVEKYGRENHVREILEFSENREELMKREREIVNDELLENQKCMNLKKGGEGGFTNADHVLKCSIAGKRKFLEKMKNDISFRNKMKEINSEKTKRVWKRKEYREKVLKCLDWNGKKHTDETKRRIGEANQKKQSGSYNSQFEKVWMYRDCENIKVKIEDVERLILEGWKRGRYVEKNKKVWIQNGIHQTRIEIDQLDHFLKSGWNKGRLVKNGSLG